jgi:RNA polymerase sigma-70 factor (ECF subfamily)
MKQSDEQLIASYLKGDEKAFTVLLQRHLKSIYAFVYRFVGNAQDTEDVTQDTFVKAWKHLKKYRRGERFTTWLFSIARNTAIDRLRKKRGVSFSDFENATGDNAFIAQLTDPKPLPDELALKARDAKTLERTLGQIPPKYREVLLLHYINNFTFNEIGVILKKPAETVKSQHRRALIILRHIMHR